jgi:uncharacterized protein YndB with AHSA1/START domain
MKLRVKEKERQSASRVERETLLDATPDEVWDAISSESRLEEWLADEVELDLVEGGDAVFRFEDEERRGTVERVEEGSGLAFTWARPGEPPSLVELTVEALPAGTRLVVVESTPTVGPMAAAGPVACGLGSGAWGSRLATLREIVRFALVA